MNWHNREHFDLQYFRDLSTALVKRTFLQPDASCTHTEQVGRYIVDRVDGVLADVIQLDPLPAIGIAAIEAFEHAVEVFPDEITCHFRDTAGSQAFAGLFATRNLDIYAMWTRIAQRTQSIWHAEDNWLHKLACTLMRDTDFASKLHEAGECSRQGLDRRHTLTQIEQHYRAMETNNASAKSLLVLDLL